MKKTLTTYTLAIVCPMANEQDTAEAFTRELLDACAGFKSVTMFAILDRACTDHTLSIMQNMVRDEPRLQVIQAPENRCVVDAYVRGYREALAHGADWILEIDAGYSHRPEDVAKFLPYISDQTDCIFGSRFCAGGSISNSSRLREWVSRRGSVVSRILLGVSCSDMTSGFEMFNRSALQAVMNRGIVSRGHFFQTEIKAYCRKVRWVEVPICYQHASGSLSLTSWMDAIKGLLRLFQLRLMGKL